MPNIHATAIVDPKAQIAEDAFIGPYCIIGPNVTIGSKTKLIANCYITGYTTIGESNTITAATIGTPPQDVHWSESMISYVKIGNNNIIREYATIHSSAVEGGATIIGNNCFLMCNTHLAHDVKAGNKVVVVTYAGVAGHAQLMDSCFISGLSAIHQRCRVGRYAMLSGGSAISRDLPPFMIADGRHGNIGGINVVALRRSNFPAETIRIIKDIYQVFYREGSSQNMALEKIKKELPQIPEVVEFIEFVESSQRGVLNALSLGRRD